MTEIRENAFWNCWSLAMVRLPKNPNLTISRGAFHCCDSVTTIELPRMALAVWPRCLEQFNDDRHFARIGLSKVGNKTCMFSVLVQNAPELFEDRRHPAVIVNGRGKRLQHEQQY